MCQPVAISTDNTKAVTAVGYKSLPLGGKVLNGHEVSHEADEGTTFPIDVGLNETVRPPRMTGVSVIENAR